MLNQLQSLLTFRNAIYFFSFIAGWPCVFYLMGWLPGYQFNYILLFIVSFLFILSSGYGSLPRPIQSIIFIQICCWIFYSLIHSDSSYYTRILLLIITFCLLKMQYYDTKPTNLMRIYNCWLSLQVVCGAIGMTLVIIGLLKPLSVFIEMDGRPGYFFGLFTTNTYLGPLVRNAGFFDEPGALAFWGVYALLLNKLFIKNKIIEYILLIGLISTLSMAYFIQVTVYLLVFYRKQSWRLIMTVLVLYIIIKIVASYDSTYYNAIFGRFEYNETTGSFQGDNRSELFERCWRIFCDYPIFGIGARKLASPEIAHIYGFVGANGMLQFASDGIIGAIITYLPIICLLSLGKKDNTWYGIVIILLLGFMQRPYDAAQLLFPLMTYSLFLFAHIKTENKNINDVML